MRFGPLRHRVEIQSLESSPGQYGEPSEEWVSQGKVWAQINPTGSREFVEAQAEFGETSFNVIMRPRDLTPQHRLVHNGVYYNVRGVQPSNERDRMTVRATTGVTDGGG